MKIGFLNAWTENFKEISDLTTPNKKEYCLKQKYTYLSKCYSAYSRHPNYTRIEFCLENLSKFDWLFVNDCDSLIMNHNIFLEQFIDNKTNFIASYDFSGPNIGNFFVKNSEWSNYFLNTLLNRKLFEEQPAEDQLTFNVLYMSKGDNIKNISLVSQKFFNSYLYSLYPDYEKQKTNNILQMWKEGDYKDGQFLLHFPGMMNEQRIQLIQEYLTKVNK